MNKVIKLSKSRLLAILCIVGVLSFFALATHWHSDSHQDVKCPVCQAGSVHAIAAYSLGSVEAPRIVRASMPSDAVAEEIPALWGSHAPRGPPA